jgi:peptidoglycan/xylan/chitin deacetylase (PgdA/CDA1 family)
MPSPIPILMYHQVDAPPPRGTPMRGLVVSPAAFARHMATLRALGFQGLSMRDLLPYLTGQRTGRVFGITFDDGYENNLRCALPVLQRFGFSSTCYMVADRVGQYNDWDRQRGVPQVPLMSAEQMQAWIDAGQEIGSHTLTHPELPALDAAQQRREIVGARWVLEGMIRQPGGVRSFCYPYGAFDQASISSAKQAGYDTATTTIRGRVGQHHGRDLITLPRVLVSRTTSCIHLVLKCLTRYEDRRGARVSST